MEIITNAKRGKSKTTKDVGMLDFYKHYTKRSKANKRSHVDIATFRLIINEFNKEFINEIVLNNEVIKLPYKLGHIGINKYRAIFNPDKQGFWPVDYKKSKELGMIVYYDQDYRYKWKWVKKEARVVGQKRYRFQPCRAASRLIAKALRENSRLDYCQKII